MFIKKWGDWNSLRYNYIFLWKGLKRFLEHRYLVEQYLGRKLNKNEVVHHINKISYDNRLENLIVMTKAEHTRLHKLGNKNTLGQKRTKEQRLRMSIAQKKHRLEHPEYKDIWSHKGKTLSLQTRKKMSNAHKGKKQTKEWAMKRAAARKATLLAQGRTV